MEDYAKLFIMPCRPDDVDDGEVEGRYVIHMPYKTPHMVVYDLFWAWVNTNQNLIVKEKSFDDFPRSYLMFTAEGDAVLCAEFQDYIGNRD